MGRVGLAFRCFFRILAGKPLPPEALPAREVAPALPPAPAAEDVSRRALAIQLLGLLQKEGRLVDFLEEDIDDYTDAQVGAAVRAIHRDCRRVLHEHVGIRPLVDGEEESAITVEPGFDPSRIRLTGNVTGEPPFSGRLKHHGWAATAVSLKAPPKGHDPMVIFPAEVEVTSAAGRGT